MTETEMWRAIRAERDALRAEVERLTRANEGFMQSAEQDVADYAKMHNLAKDALARATAAEADAAAAREQVRKLREALEHFARIGRDMPPSTDMVQIGIEHFRRVARAALQGEGER